MQKIDLIRSLNFGARIAEDEINELASYFVETDQWNRIVLGEIDVVRGEKGAGKSAIFSLLTTRNDEFFDRNILLVSAETLRGTTVFRDIISDPPPTEANFIALWKLYLVSLIASQFKEFGIAGEAGNKLINTLEDQGLIKGSFDIKWLFRAARSYAQSWLNPTVEVSIPTDPSAPLPVVGIKITPNPVSPADKSNDISVDELLELANQALGSFSRSLWILLDRLDVAFADNPELERNALRALFRVYRDLADLENIRLKIFIRSDIWKRITETGFAEASHITKVIEINWNTESLLNLMVRRILSNKTLTDEYGIDKERLLSDFQEQNKLFQRLFPDQVDQGSKKPSTLDWMISRCSDGTKKTAPREIIHLLTELRNEEIKWIEQGQPPAPDEQLFNRSVFKLALPIVSEARLLQTLYAEYPNLKNSMESLRNEKTEHSLESLAKIWSVQIPDANTMAEKLISVGFFERRGTKEEPTYWVPFLYRDALNLVQGSSDN